MALEDHGLKPGNGPVLVTGAAGGVGSVAVALLAALGHEVAGVTGRPETADYLTSLGASQIVAREELNETTKRPLEAETWAGCVDAVGGDMLARVLGQMKYGASVSAVGLAGGAGLPATVIPFLLRGVNLLGIDSVMQPYDNRLRAWEQHRDRTMSVKPPLTDLPIKTADSGFYRGFSVNVAVISKIIISMLVVWCIVWPSEAGTILGNWNSAILAQFAAWYIWVVAAFVIVCLGLALWPAGGRLNLGQDGEVPEFSNFSWFSMMFGAGIGVGMLTWAVAEPIAHFKNNPAVIQGVTTAIWGI